MVNPQRDKIAPIEGERKDENGVYVIGNRKHDRNTSFEKLEDVKPRIILTSAREEEGRGGKMAKLSVEEFMGEEKVFEPLRPMVPPHRHHHLQYPESQRLGKCWLNLLEFYYYRFIKCNWSFLLFFSSVWCLVK